jgi:hypothetical protein
MMKTVAMMQSNYIPWKGIFDMIHSVDCFVFYDDVQYTKKDWRSRNKIPQPNGKELWLTVPVLTKNRRFQLICEAEINQDDNWQEKHYKTLVLNYKKSPYFSKYEEILNDFYMEHRWENLSEMNIYMTKVLSQALGIKTKFYNSADLHCTGSKDGEKVIKICEKLGCDYFINGPAAQSFMDVEKFKEANITLDYMNYEYPEYKQLTTPFNHYVTVLDLLFNTGENAPYYIWGWKSQK